MPPITLLIKPASSLCNMRCKYCFYADVAENRTIQSFGMMSDETLENLVRKALNYADVMCTFAFQGGEPTLAGIDFYKKLLNLEKKYNYKNLQIYNTIQTNGYNIDDEFMRFLSVNNFLVGLSMDGSKEIHDTFRVDAKQKGTFDIVQKTAKRFDRHKVEYNILCVVNNLIASNPDSVYSALKKYKFIQFIPCIDHFDGEQDIYSLTPDKYTEFLKKTFDRYYLDFMRGKYVSIRNFDNYIHLALGGYAENCAMKGVCTCYFVIEGDGSTFPCDFYVLDKWKLGNINTDSFPRMIKTAKAQEFVDSSKYTNPKCEKCDVFNLCRGGCRRDREPFADGKPALNKYCDSYKEFLTYAHERMLEIAEKVKAMHQS